MPRSRPEDRQYAKRIAQSMAAVAEPSQQVVDAVPVWGAANDWLEDNGQGGIPLGTWARAMQDAGYRMQKAVPGFPMTIRGQRLKGGAA